jgi:hypothetical protein
MPGNAVTREDIQNLIKRMTEAQTKAAARHWEAQLRNAVFSYLRAIVERAGGVVDDQVKQEADWILEQAGLEGTIAGALGLARGKVRWLLARERQVLCSQCQKEYVIVREARCKGGYTEVRASTCTTCRQLAALERAKAERGEKTELLLEDTLHRHVEDQITRAIVSGRDPLEIIELRDHLIAYAVYWRVGAARQYISEGVFSAPSGCMICGAQPPRLFVVTLAAGQLHQRKKCNAWRAMHYCLGYFDSDEAPDADLPPPLSVFHALWRLAPASYFSAIPPFPICEMPLLLLCDEHIGVGGLAHRELQTGDMNIEKQADGSVLVKAEATGVRYRVRRGG